MPDSRPNNPNTYQRIIWLLVLILITAVSVMILLVTTYLILHATVVPAVEVDSTASYFSFNSTDVHWGIYVNLDNPNKIAAVKHTHVEVSLYYDRAFGCLNGSLPSFVVKPSEKAVVQATFESTSLKAERHFRHTTSLWSSLMDGDSITVKVDLTMHRSIGLFGRIWFPASDLYLECEDLVFEDPAISPSPSSPQDVGSSGGGVASTIRKIMGGNVACSISSFLVYL